MCSYKYHLDAIDAPSSRNFRNGEASRRAPTSCCRENRNLVWCCFVTASSRSESELGSLTLDLPSDWRGATLVGRMQLDDGPSTPWEALYREKIGQLADGAVLEFAVGYRKIAEVTQRHNH